MNDLKESLAFLIHSVKQFVFGFEILNATASEYEDGSPAMAYYMTSFYNYAAAFYLIDRKAGDAHGGTIYKTLKPYGLDHHLQPIFNILSRPIGSTTFGEIVRVFRNKTIVHTTYSDSDLDRIYRDADMADPAVEKLFHDCLLDLYHETKLLPIKLIKDTDFSPADFGITLDPNSEKEM